MFDTISQSVNLPKRDLLSVVANVPPGSLNGCKWCGKTILWNGGTWVHVNDQPKCESGYKGGPHDLEVVGHMEVEIGKTFFGGKPIMEKAKIHRCSACGEQKPANLMGDYWFPSLAYECPVKVATPVVKQENP